MQPECSLPCSKQPATCPYPESNEQNLRSPPPFRFNAFWLAAFYYVKHFCWGIFLIYDHFSGTGGGKQGKSVSTEI